MFDSRVIRKGCVIAGILLAMGVAVYSQIDGMKDFPNRREGTVKHPDALHDFVLLAVHRNFKPFPHNANLNVRFFLPGTGAQANDISVRAIGLMGSTHYLMESKGPIPLKDGNWRVFGPWPTRDMIEPLKLDPSNIGVLAQYRVGNDRPIILPVDVYQSEKELTRGVYTFYFMTNKDLQALDVSVTNAQGKAVKVPIPELKCPKKFYVECIQYHGGEDSHQFELDLSSLPDGEYRVKLVGHVLNDATPLSPPEIVIYHHSLKGQL
jgi:hypothetical protein